MFPISSAPRDGTEIYAWVGQHWRSVRWSAGGPLVKDPGWYFQRWMKVQATHWHPVKGAPQELLDEMLKGFLPASRVRA